MNGLQSYVLDNLISDSEGIELVFLAYADDIAVAVSSYPQEWEEVVGYTKGRGAGEHMA
jgi:hypothetical protein